MNTISKRSGLEQDFRRGKIADSVRAAGVSLETAKEIAAGIRYHEGMTTREVRNQVIGRIRNPEPQAAMQYEWHPKKTYSP